MILDQHFISQLTKFWNVSESLVFHRRVANFVYFSNIHKLPIVIRITEPSHRNFAELESELDWMSYLKLNGLGVAVPIPSNDGHLVQRIENRGQVYFVSIFERAFGSQYSESLENQSAIIQNWGRFIGKMHCLTKNYAPDSKILLRQQWRQDESLAMALRSHKKSDQLAYDRLNQLLAWMEGLPEDKNSYGLVHCDLHNGNFLLIDDQLTAFDFDDCCYHWFSYDLVAPINSICKNTFEGLIHREKEQAQMLFLAGYVLENELPEIWIKRIPLFDQYRACLVYHWAKTCIAEKVFDQVGLTWAEQKLPQLRATFSTELEYI